MFNAISNDEIAVDGAVAQETMQKIKDDLDFLNGAIMSSVAANVPNGSMELDADEDGIPDNWQWTASGGSGAVDSFSGDGAKSFKFTSAGAGGGGTLVSDLIPINDSAQYFLNWLAAKNNLTMTLQVIPTYYSDAGITIIGTPTAIYNDTPASFFVTWLNHLFLLTPPSGARYVTFTFIGSGADGSAIYIDGVKLLDCKSVKCLANFGVSEIYAQNTSNSTTGTLPLPFATNLAIRLAFYGQAYKTYGGGTATQQFTIAGVAANGGVAKTVVDVSAYSTNLLYKIDIPANNQYVKQGQLPVTMGITVNSGYVYGKRNGSVGSPDYANFVIEYPDYSLLDLRAV
jgi:hypothetical protein